MTEKAAGTTTGPKSKSQSGEDKASVAKQREVREKAVGGTTGSKSKSPSGEDKASAVKQWEVREKAVGVTTGSKSNSLSGEDKASAVNQEESRSGVSDINPQLGTLGVIDISPQFAPHVVALGGGTLGEGIREGEGKKTPPRGYGFHCQGVERHAPFLHGGPVPCRQDGL